MEDWASCGGDLSKIGEMIKTHYFIVAVNQQLQIVGFSSGTRRRFSYEMQDKVVGILKEYMDSGDPFVFTQKAIEHYRKKRIDPRTKTIVYSDALDLDNIRKIKEFVDGRLHDVYGAGTYLTNDVGVRPLNMVIKLFECKPKGYKFFLPTVKLSDAEGKHTGDPEEMILCIRVLCL